MANFTRLQPKTKLLPRSKYLNVVWKHLYSLKDKTLNHILIPIQCIQPVKGLYDILLQVHLRNLCDKFILTSSEKSRLLAEMGTNTSKCI